VPQDGIPASRIVLLLHFSFSLLGAISKFAVLAQSSFQFGVPIVSL
jgi:hypothetical protein